MPRRQRTALPNSRQNEKARLDKRRRHCDHFAMGFSKRQTRWCDMALHARASRNSPQKRRPNNIMPLTHATCIFPFYFSISLTRNWSRCRYGSKSTRRNLGISIIFPVLPESFAFRVPWWTLNFLLCSFCSGICIWRQLFSSGHMGNQGIQSRKSLHPSLIWRSVFSGKHIFCFSAYSLRNKAFWYPCFSNR